MRVALCQINPTVGDIRGNCATILRFAQNASNAGAQVAVFPELAVSGYPPRDLLERKGFVRAQRAAVDELAKSLPPGLAVVLGFVERSEQPAGRTLFNAAGLLASGRIQAVVHKQLLPTYDVFDEDRYFEAGESSHAISICGAKVGLTVCEDIWNDGEESIALGRRYRHNPVPALVQDGARVLINLSASPFTVRKSRARTQMLARIAKRYGVHVVYVNQVGGNDELVFDGASAVFGPAGECRASAKRFEEDMVVVDLNAPPAAHAEVAHADASTPASQVQPSDEHSRASDAQRMLDALCLGTRDYARKCGFHKAVLGLSGGIDSAVTACVAARALGAENVLGVAMPSRYSSDHSLRDAEDLASALGISYRVISIEHLFQSYASELSSEVDALRPAFPGDVTWENVQSRIRGNVLMAISNRAGHLLLSTGNKSEVAMGYCTLYGDMAGGLSVLSDVPKTWVYRLADEINCQSLSSTGRPVIPESSITKPPSAELRPGQTDQDSLPPYEVLDAILERYIEQGMTSAEIAQEGFDSATVEFVVRLLNASEYKRRQMAPGLIVSGKAFGSGRRYPIAQRYVDQA